MIHMSESWCARARMPIDPERRQIVAIVDLGPTSFDEEQHYEVTTAASGSRVGMALLRAIQCGEDVNIETIIDLCEGAEPDRTLKQLMRAGPGNGTVRPITRDGVLLGLLLSPNEKGA